MYYVFIYYCFYRDGGFLRKVTNTFSRSVFCIFMVLSIMCSLAVTANANPSYISDIAIATGKDAVSKLEHNGYNVLFQGLNVETDEDSMVYLGYKKGDKPITNLVVSAQKSDTVTVDSVSYSLVSDINLNKGTKGKALYLYFTRDTKAGGGITSLDTVAGYPEKEEVLPLKNDGSSPVRTNEGKPADFDDGISDCELYVLMQRDNEICQYISNACLVSGETKADAIKAAAGNGCDYYLENNLNDANGYTFIAFQRTKNKSDAITKLDWTEEELTFEKDASSSTYLLDITKSRQYDDSFLLGDWLALYAARTRAIKRNSDKYDKLSENKSPCSCVPLNATNDIYACYLGNVAQPKVDSPAEETTLVQTITEAKESDATDEYLDIDKTDEEESISGADPDQNGEMEAASIIGDGNIKEIIALSLIMVVILILTIISRKRRGKENEEQNS